MKKFKKVMAVMMAAAMAMSMVACGGNGGTATEAPDTLVLGGIGPTTGTAAQYGIAVKNGAQLAVEEINEAGGVNGMKLSWEFQDDQADGEKAVNAYNTLKDNGMKMLVGTVTSGACFAVVEKTAEDNMFQLTPSGSAVKCIEGDHAFRICFNDDYQGTASAQYIADRALASKVAVIYDSSDEYSSGIYATFAAEAQVKGLEIVETQAFTKDTKTDFSVQLQKVKESGAELVFLPIYYSEAASILQQAAKVEGLDVQWFGCDGLDGLTAQLGEEVALAEGVMLLTPFVADSEEAASKAFTDKYVSKFGETPNQFAADAYDAIYVIKAALEKAGVKNTAITVDELCELMKEAMVEIEVAGVTGTMTWDANGEPTKEAKAMMIVNGAYTAMP